MTSLTSYSQTAMRLTVIVALPVVFAALCGPGCYASANDSVPALAQALSELPSDRSVFDLPEGTYTIASTWTISRPGVTIHGAGIGKTVLVRDPSFNGIMVKMNGIGNSITDLTIDGNGTSRALFLNGKGGAVKMIEVKNYSLIGIGVTAGDCVIDNCLITGSGSDAIRAFGIWRDAGKTDTSSALTITNNTIKNNGTCAIYCTGGKVTIANNQVSGNHIITTIGGGQFDIGNAYSTNTIAVITGNTITDGGGLHASGLELGGGNYTVLNNTIRNHGLGGIWLGHNVIKAVVSGNTISNSGRYVADTNNPQFRSAIFVAYGAVNVQITGNRCFDDQPNKTQTWGVILVGLPSRADPRVPFRATDHVLARGNDLRGNIHPEGLLDQSGARDRSISGNFPSRANR
jgi:Right handed beta helix region